MFAAVVRERGITMLRRLVVAFCVVSVLVLIVIGTQDNSSNQAHLMPYSGIRMVVRQVYVGQCPAYTAEYYRCISDDREELLAKTTPSIHWFTPLPKWFWDETNQLWDELCIKYGTVRCQSSSYIWTSLRNRGDASLYMGQ